MKQPSFSRLAPPFLLIFSLLLCFGSLSACIEQNPVQTATTVSTERPSIEIQSSEPDSAGESLAETQLSESDATEQSSAETQLSEPDSTEQSSAEAQSLETISTKQLTPEARETLALIYKNGPFPYSRDGIVFENREKLLPIKTKGYYREYTVPTPGAKDRGARRIVCGGDKPSEPDICYYTDDHYLSFQRIQDETAKP